MKLITLALLVRLAMMAVAMVMMGHPKILVACPSEDLLYVPNTNRAKRGRGKEWGFQIVLTATPSTKNANSSNYSSAHIALTVSNYV